MGNNFNIINAEALIKAMEDVDNNRLGQLSSRDFEIEQSETKPLPGYEAPVLFPNCCPYHSNLLKIGQDFYQKFPNCCDAHNNLHKAPWFRKEKYAYLPLKLVITISYTHHCITECIEHTNWYREITDYIDYTKSSYGQLPDGYGPPVGLELYYYNLEKLIESENKIPQQKKEQLIAFIKSDHRSPEHKELTDLNLLIDKYRKWLKIFPFELSFFRELKPYFENQIPILRGPGVTNMYTGLTGFKILNQKELIAFLVRTTLSIIQQINTRRLYEEGQLNQAEKIQLELISANRKLELEELDQAEWHDRKHYINLLKKWLHGEKQFITEITPLLKNLKHPVFIQDMIAGIKLLQKNDVNEQCILNVRNNLPDKEAGFRNWFKNFFTARYPDANVTAEEEKGNGRMDIKITKLPFGDKIIEFKGWWNWDKIQSPQQICSYLTDFEQDGYIFMINDRKTKEIIEHYEALIKNPATGYQENSWKSHQVEGTDFFYFESTHLLAAKPKTVYHFIFNAWFSNQAKDV